VLRGGILDERGIFLQQFHETFSDFSVKSNDTANKVFLPFQTLQLNEVVGRR
jgi:hypothetical protein